MTREQVFSEIKGNCVDRLDIGGIDHCTYHEDDCEDNRCPQMKEYNPIVREEAQCSTCGSVVIAHEISKPNPTLLQGILYGMTATMLCFIGLWAMCRFVYIPPEVQLYLLNYIID